MPNPARGSFNPKRALAQPSPPPAALNELAERIGYGGNPEPKRAPGDFGLTPPSSPRPDKTLCDGAGIVSRAAALAALRSGVLKGMVSRRVSGGFPQNIWSVVNGIAFEAQLENGMTGIYHGYPLTAADAFSRVVLRTWIGR